MKTLFCMLAILFTAALSTISNAARADTGAYTSYINTHYDDGYDIHDTYSFSASGNTAPYHYVVFVVECIAEWAIYEDSHTETLSGSDITYSQAVQANGSGYASKSVSNLVDSSAASATINMAINAYNGSPWAQVKYHIRSEVVTVDSGVAVVEEDSDTYTVNAPYGG